MNELQALVAGVLEDLDGAGALADWLAENGREREAVLLRRRWRLWKTMRAKWAAAARYPVPFGDNLAASCQGDDDRNFRNYIRERFKGGMKLSDVKMWVKLHGVSHVLTMRNGGALMLACGIMNYGGYAVPYCGRRICRKCRARLPDLPPLAPA